MTVLESTATGDGQWDNASGWGEIDPQAALKAVEDDPSLNTLTPLYGAGPNAAGPAGDAKAVRGQSMQPVVPTQVSAAQVDQEHGADDSLALAALVVALAAGGSMVARASRERRGGTSR
jgi:hypothetical protein